MAVSLALSMGVEAFVGRGRLWRDYSPNNGGFAMADWHAPINVRVTGWMLNLREAPIDNNPTPSYLSLSVGHWLIAGAFGVEFARKVPHSGAPEANPAATA
jgi:hypothetical protein